MICSPATAGRGGDSERCPLSAETYSLGLPVEVGKIDQRAEKTLAGKRRRDDARLAH